jgi:hypothetical protein
MAIKSSSEVEAQLELARAYGLVTSDSLRTMIDEVTSIRRQLHSLRIRVLNAVKPEATNPKPAARHLRRVSPIENPQPNQGASTNVNELRRQ